MGISGYLEDHPQLGLVVSNHGERCCPQDWEVVVVPFPNGLCKWFFNGDPKNLLGGVPSSKYLLKCHVSPREIAGLVFGIMKPIIVPESSP